jgi:hypothetical protein
MRSGLAEAATIDWREDYSSLSYRVTTVPRPVEAAVTEFMRYFGLAFGAFDFVVTPSGEWRFLECNPNGQWAWLERYADVPISQAIADLLRRGKMTR